MGTYIGEESTVCELSSDRKQRPESVRGPCQGTRYPAVSDLVHGFATPQAVIKRRASVLSCRVSAAKSRRHTPEVRTGNKVGALVFFVRYLSTSPTA